MYQPKISNKELSTFHIHNFKMSALIHSSGMGDLYRATQTLITEPRYRGLHQ